MVILYPGESLNFSQRPWCLKGSRSKHKLETWKYFFLFFLLPTVYYVFYTFYVFYTKHLWLLSFIIYRCLEPTTPCMRCIDGESCWLVLRYVLFLQCCSSDVAFLWLFFHEVKGLLGWILFERMMHFLYTIPITGHNIFKRIK